MIEMTEDLRDQKLYMSEIIILAGIMGYSSLPGIMDAGVLSYRENVKSNAQKMIAALEERGVLNIRPEKNAYIKQEIYHKVKMIAECEELARLITYDHRGKRVTQWIYHKQQERMLLTQSALEDENGLLQCRIAEKNDTTECQDGDQWILTMQEIADYRQKILDFDLENVEEQLGQRIEDQQIVSLLLDFFSGRISLCKATQWRRCQDIFKRQESIGYIKNDNIILMIVADVQGFVFQKISPENMIEIIENCVLKGRGQWKISL